MDAHPQGILFDLNIPRDSRMAIETCDVLSDQETDRSGLPEAERQARRQAILKQTALLLAGASRGVEDAIPLTDRLLGNAAINSLFGYIFLLRNEIDQAIKRSDERISQGTTWGVLESDTRATFLNYLIYEAVE